MQPESKTRTKATGRRYITGFDGLRTLAVLGVIIYHLLPSTLQGGYLGVPIFLLITGYLITSHLTKEIDRTGRIKLGKFYWKRLTRLTPVLVTMLVATTAYITLFQRVLLHNIRVTIVTNLLYVYNWWEVGHGESYFDRFNGESPFTHLWTLGVEAQFYLIWPLILIIMFKVFKQKKWIKWTTLALAIISAILMAVMYDPHNINRVYYGTDTRASALLLGALLAMVWPADKLKKNINKQAVRTLDVVGIISTALILIGYFFLSGQATFTYYGGMFLFSVVGMLLIAVIVHPGGHVNAWFSNPVFKWVGDRSYGIYVYQYPVLVFYESTVKNLADHPFLHAFAEMIIILVISDLSFRFIEKPLLRYDWKKLWQTVRGWFNISKGWHQWYAIVPALIITVIAFVGLVQEPTKAAPNKMQTQINKKAAKTKERNEAIKKGKVAANTNQDADTLTEKYALSKSEVAKAKKLKLTAIGDSVLVDGSEDLQDLVPNAYVSAAVGRQIWQAPGIIKSLAKKGQLSDTVVINLGTNGTLDTPNVNKVLKAIGSKRQIYWITAHVPTKNWQTSVNETIHSLAKKHKNVHVVDWYSYSKDHPEWFSKDSVHPNTDGNAQFVHLLVKTIVDNQ